MKQLCNKKLLYDTSIIGYYGRCVNTKVRIPTISKLHFTIPLSFWTNKKKTC